MTNWHGEIFSLTTALFWAVGVVLFRQSTLYVSSLALNLFKSVFSLALLLLTMLFFNTQWLPEMDLNGYLVLAVSGILGLAAADTLFFASLRLLGASVSAVVNILYAPFVILCGFLLLGERLSALDYIGGAFVLAAVFMLSQAKQAEVKNRQDLIKGIVFGVLAMALTAFSIVLVKPILLQSSLLWVNVVRLIVGILALIIMGTIRPPKGGLWCVFRPHRSWRYLLPASLFGTYFALILWLAGMKYTLVGISSILNQLSTVFIVLLAAIFLREPLTLNKTLAMITGFIGASLVFF